MLKPEILVVQGSVTCCKTYAKTDKLTDLDLTLKYFIALWMFNCSLLFTVDGLNLKSLVSRVTYCQFGA